MMEIVARIAGRLLGDDRVYRKPYPSLYGNGIAEADEMIGLPSPPPAVLASPFRASYGSKPRTRCFDIS